MEQGIQGGKPELSRLRRGGSFVLFCLMAGLSFTPWELRAGNPTGGVVASGSATFANSGNTLNVTNSNGTVINWNDFSITAGYTTNFIQANAASSVLNRVTGTNISAIYGTLSSNGKVFLINPNGIMVGAGGMVNTAGFVGSTLNISDTDFLNGNLHFQGNSAGTIQNLGTIKAHSGDVFLIAKQIDNQGTVQANKGVAGLYASDEVYLTTGQADAGSVRVASTSFTGGTGISNSGLIQAAQAELKATGNMYSLAINNTGAVRATGTSVRNGVVHFGAIGGTIQSSGLVKAVNKDGSGGTVKIQTGAGGTTLVNGTVDVSSATAGKKGGYAELTGDDVALYDNGLVDASGPAGGGTVLIGGDSHGANSSVYDAQAVYLGSGATVKADATDSGDGGKVVVWSNEMTRFYGLISAKGGPTGGNGGWVETSGHTLQALGTVDLYSAHGRGGTWLLDPADLTIVNTNGTIANSGPANAPIFSSSDTASFLLNSSINSQLAAGNNVIIETGGTSGTGNITQSAGAPISSFNGTSYGTGSLTLTAAGGISIEFNIDLNGTLTLNAGTTINLTGATVQTRGGDINLYAGGTGTGSIQIISSTLNTALDPSTSFPGSSTGSTGGGSIRMGANDGSGNLITLVATDTDAIQISSSHLYADGGNITLKGETQLDGLAAGAYAGIQIENDTNSAPSISTTGTGAIEIDGWGHGLSDNSGGIVSGIVIDNATVTNETGGLTLNGQADGVGSLYAVQLTDGAFVSVTGGILNVIASTPDEQASSGLYVGNGGGGGGDSAFSVGAGGAISVATDSFDYDNDGSAAFQVTGYVPPESDPDLYIAPLTPGTEMNVGFGESGLTVSTGSIGGGFTHVFFGSSLYAGSGQPLATAGTVGNVTAGDITLGLGEASYNADGDLDFSGSGMIDIESNININSGATLTLTSSGGVVLIQDEGGVNMSDGGSTNGHLVINAANGATIGQIYAQQLDVTVAGSGGNLTINEEVTTAGALNLSSGGSISITSDIDTGGGNLTAYSNTSRSGGAISIGTGGSLSINTEGGNVILAGGVGGLDATNTDGSGLGYAQSTDGYGILLNGVQINAIGEGISGNITLRGRSVASSGGSITGIRIATSSLDTDNGKQISITGEVSTPGSQSANGAIGVELLSSQIGGIGSENFHLNLTGIIGIPTTLGGTAVPSGGFGDIGVYVHNEIGKGSSLISTDTGSVTMTGNVYAVDGGGQGAEIGVEVSGGTLVSANTVSLTGHVFDPIVGGGQPLPPQESEGIGLLITDANTEAGHTTIVAGAGGMTLTGVTDYTRIIGSDQDYGILFQGGAQVWIDGGALKISGTSAATFTPGNGADIGFASQSEESPTIFAVNGAVVTVVADSIDTAGLDSQDVTLFQGDNLSENETFTSGGLTPSLVTPDVHVVIDEGDQIAITTADAAVKLVFQTRSATTSIAVGADAYAQNPTALQATGDDNFGQEVIGASPLGGPAYAGTVYLGPDSDDSGLDHNVIVNGGTINVEDGFIIQSNVSATLNASGDINYTGGPDSLDLQPNSALLATAGHDINWNGQTTMSGLAQMILSAGHQLTLGAGSNIDIQDTGTFASLVASSGTFVNNGGAGAITTLYGGFYVISAATAAATTLGGLTPTQQTGIYSLTNLPGVNSVYYAPVAGTSSTSSDSALSEALTELLTNSSNKSAIHKVIAAITQQTTASTTNGDAVVNVSANGNGSGDVVVADTKSSKNDDASGGNDNNHGHTLAHNGSTTSNSGAPANEHVVGAGSVGTIGGHVGVNLPPPPALNAALTLAVHAQLQGALQP